MAIEIIKFAASNGLFFDTAAEADAADAAEQNEKRISAFIEKHFPLKEGSSRKSRKASAIRHILELWQKYNIAEA